MLRLTRVVFYVSYHNRVGVSPLEEGEPVMSTH